MKKDHNYLLDIGISNLSKTQVLEEIKKWLDLNRGVSQIVTVNPEFLVLAQKNKRFKKTLNNAQIAIADGIGTLWAGKILECPFKERIAGVDLMKRMIKMASDHGFTVGLIGGKGDLAVKTAECLKVTCPNFKFFALEGFKNVKKQSGDEWREIVSITNENKPQMLFVAFGAPWQEFFIEALEKKLGFDWPMVAIGVGGAFDEISGQVRKAPHYFDRIGLKWLWRLTQELWRWRRQLALLEFVWLVLKKKYRNFRGGRPVKSPEASGDHGAGT